MTLTPPGICCLNTRFFADGKWQIAMDAMAISGGWHSAAAGARSRVHVSPPGNGTAIVQASTRVSLWDSLIFGRLATGFANVRASRYGIR